MKYLAIFDDTMLSNFRLDDGGLTLVLTDKNWCTRAVALKPIIRPVLTITEDCERVTETASLYLTQGHIDALIEYDKNEVIKEILRKTTDELMRGEEE